jgi:acyl-CoA thioester hydrolase
MTERVVEIPLRWGDQDSYGHVNSVAVARLLEEARARVLWGAGSALPPLSPDEATLSLVSEIGIRYLRVLDYREEPVPIALSVSRIGGADLTIEFEVRSDDPARPYATATAKVALVDRMTGNVRRLSADEREFLRGFAPPA